MPERNQKMNLEISWMTLWRIAFFFAMAMLVFSGRNVLIGLFLAMVISSGLERPIAFLERRGFPRVLGAISVFVLGLSAFILLIYLIVPLLIAEINNAVLSLGKSVGGSGLGPFLSPETLKAFTDSINKISISLFSPLSASPFGALSQVLGGLSLAAAVFVSSFYLCLSRDGVQRFIRAVFPSSTEDVAIRVYERSRKQIGLWFRTQILLSVIMGFLVWIALSILGVRHAFLLGLLAALFEIVPYVGPILAGAAAVLVALTSSPGLALTTLIVFLGIQQLENHLLVPILMRRTVGLHPVIVIIALLIGAEILGVLGILIAVPVAAVFQEVVDEWSSRKKPRA